MHSNIRNRLFSLLLTFAMLCSLLPATALATEDGADSGTPVACTQGEGCEADSHDEGCPLYAEPEEETEDSVEDEPDDMTNAVIAALYPTEVVEDDPADVDSWKNCKTCSKDNPHMIYTTADLDKIRTHYDDKIESITGYFKLANDIVFDNADFAEGGAFYNGGKGFEPIGVYGKPVNGSTVTATTVTMSLS